MVAIGEALKAQNSIKEMMNKYPSSQAIKECATTAYDYVVNELKAVMFEDPKTISLAARYAADGVEMCERGLANEKIVDVSSIHTLNSNMMLLTDLVLWVAKSLVCLNRKVNHLNRWLKIGGGGDVWWLWWMASWKDKAPPDLHLPPSQPNLVVATEERDVTRTQNRDRHELELDFNRFWDEFWSSSSEKEREAALNWSIDAFCRLVKQQTNVAQLVTVFVQKLVNPELTCDATSQTIPVVVIQFAKVKIFRGLLFMVWTLMLHFL
ncbi:unnamed protein product [Trifolium pratense]|uniref:Uncharacterized protein n=1 Tax=Trifolium pratense TaxID=57577 RepID=A0ACB0LVP0_TRIPR|nr:unnamed protein product [Trifolium pratense]